jgi:DNA-binding NarL/FixJ family response regulator
MKDSQMKLLIADDSAVVRERLIALLAEITGIENIGEAVDIPTALNYFKKYHPDVVILDISMPGGSGIDVLKAIKNNGTPTKVVVLTNYPYPQYKKRCRELGADYFFDKSTEFEKVIETLNKLIQNSHTNCDKKIDVL